MQRRPACLTAVLLLVAIVVLTGCGRKGPLYLPPTEETAEQAETGNQD